MNQRPGITEANNSCNRQVPRLAGTVLLWITAVLTMVTLQTTAHAQELTSFSDGVGEHVVFVANDYHVHQLLCSAGSFCETSTYSNWINQDLTAMAGGPSLVVLQYPYIFNSAGLTSFGDAAGEHVFYRDPNTLHLNQLLLAGGVWSNHDLGVSAWSASTSGYSDSGVERLFYRAGNQHIHMLSSQNGLSWSDSDLTSITGGALAFPWFTATTSFHDAFGEHVFYVGDNGHLYQFYGSWHQICRPPTPWGPGWCSQSWLMWVNQDLGGQPYGYTRLTSLSDTQGEHVFYSAYDASWALHVFEHFKPSGGSTWLDNDWGTAYGSNPVLTGLTSFSENDIQQLLNVGSDLHIYTFTGYNGMRTGSLDLTLDNHGPLVSTGCTFISSFTDNRIYGYTLNNVFYVAQGGDLHRLLRFQDGTWWDQNLTNGSGQPTFGGWPCR